MSGIWPPDVGGPASHAPEVAAFLHARGHRVEVLTSAAAPPAPEPFPVGWVSRRLPALLRYAWGAALSARAARRADVVYSTGMIGRTRIGALVARVPRVIKLTGDPAYERSLRYGLTTLSLDRFQGARGVRIGALRTLRDVMLSGAAVYVCPSESLRGFATRWRLLAPERIVVLPNPVSVLPVGERDELRRRHGLTRPTLVAAGRLVAQKRLDVALEAVRRCAEVDLVVVGDGPEREPLEALVRTLGLERRVRLVGARPRALVLELLAAADAVVLSSDWENFPHAIVEGLAVGTPVIAAAVGGVREIVRDGVNGLLVPADDPGALAAAIGRFFAEEDLRARLRSSAAPSVAEFAPERIYERLESLLERAAR